MSLSSQIKEYCKVKYRSIKVVLDQVEITVEKDNLLKLIQFLKDDPSCLFDQLSDITAVDYPNKKDRFLIIYQFLSVTNNQRVRVLCSISANDVIPSMSKLYFSANFFTSFVLLINSRFKRSISFAFSSAESFIFNKNA